MSFSQLRKRNFLFRLSRGHSSANEPNIRLKLVIERHEYNRGRQKLLAPSWCLDPIMVEPTARYAQNHDRFIQTNALMQFHHIQQILSFSRLTHHFALYITKNSINLHLRTTEATLDGASIFVLVPCRFHPRMKGRLLLSLQQGIWREYVDAVKGIPVFVHPLMNHGPKRDSARANDMVNDDKIRSLCTLACDQLYLAISEHASGPY
jgi:hypothetical protein